MRERLQYHDQTNLSKESDRQSELIAAHRMDEKNVGDFNSRPDLYYDWLNPTKVVDIEDANLSTIIGTSGSPSIIVGGGGLLFEGQFPQIYADNLDSIYKSNRKLLIGWGIGHNNHGGDKISLPDLSPYDLAGIRDYIPPELSSSQKNYHWVPCASSLHPAFNDTYEREHDVVFFQHKFHPSQKITNDLGITTMDNSGNDVNEAIRFIASADTVLTNSYHGAYWGILLGRRVIIVDPFSTKFQGLKWEVPVTSTHDWQTALQATRRYPEALHESREANDNFATLVQDRLQNLS